MFGVDDALIAAMIASIASAGLQYKASSDTAKKQQQAAVQAQQRQLQMQNQATDIAAKKASEFDPTQRQQAQQQIQQDLTGQYDQQVSAPQITAQGVQVGNTIPDAQGSSDYVMAKAKEQAKTTASLHALASLMGRVGSASQLRQNEAVGIGDAAGAIGRVGTGADNFAGIDQIGVKAAGQPNLGLMIGSAALGAYGAAGAPGLGGAGGSTGTGLTATPGQGLNLATPGGGLGLKSGGGTGIRAPLSFLR